MVRNAVGKIVWMARATTVMVGLAIMLALVLGVVTSALAALPGDPFRLGQTNGIDAMSTLVGNVAGPLLRVDNSSTGAGATALSLQVEAGKPPMKVNSGAKVAKLNTDKLDGLDSTGFYAAGSKVADSSHADLADSATSAQRATNARNATNAQNAADADKLDGLDSAALGVTTKMMSQSTEGCDTNLDGVNACAVVAVKVPAGKQYHVTVFSSFTAESTSTSSLKYRPMAQGSGVNTCTETTNVIDLAGGYAESGASSGAITLGPGTYNVSTYISPQAALSYDPLHSAHTTVQVRDATAPGPPIN